MLWGTDDVWVDVIMVLARGCNGQTDEVWVWMLSGTDEVWVDVIIVLAHGCTVERVRSRWTLYNLPMDAREQPGNYQVFYAPVSF